MDLAIVLTIFIILALSGRVGSCYDESVSMMMKDIDLGFGESESNKKPKKSKKGFNDTASTQPIPEPAAQQAAPAQPAASGMMSEFEDKLDLNELINEFNMKG